MTYKDIEYDLIAAFSALQHLFKTPARLIEGKYYVEAPDMKFWDKTRLLIYGDWEKHLPELIALVNVRKAEYELEKAKIELENCQK